jgi:predicted TIM-barrel fold metal-dependent hydrolase
VLYPQIGFLLSSVGPELKWAGIRAYNRYASDFAKAHPERYAATFMVDLGDIGRAVEEAHFAAEAGMRGGAFVAGGRPMGLPAFSDAYYAPFFAALEDLDLPFNMHGAFGGTGEAGWIGGPGAAMFNEVWINYNNLAKGGPLMHFLGGGVFERHPKLRIVVSETGGLAWAAEVLTALDEIYHAQASRSSINQKIMNPNQVARFKEFPRAPSDYFKSNCYVQGHNNLRDWAALEAVGVDNVIWASDFAHAESTWPNSVTEMRLVLQQTKTPLETVRKYLGENAARFYRFDLAKLQPHADRCGPDLEKVAEAA